MRILQTYVLKELFAPTVVSLAFFTLLLLLRHFFTLAEVLLNASVGIGLIFELAGIIVVTLFSLTIPMAALLGVLIGIGRMTSDNEILAIRVAGISLFPVFVPVFVLAALTSLLLVAGNREIPAWTLCARPIATATHPI
jgi:lipopolysaccharide export system permease protein